MNRWIRITAVLLWILLCFSACADSAPDGSDGSDGSSEENMSGSEELLILSKDGASDYQIVCRAALMDQNLAMQTVMALVGGLETRMGVKIPSVTDRESEVTEREILIGAIQNRAESIEGMNSVTAPGGAGYRVSVSGEKILISCENARLLGYAFEALLGGIVELEDGSYGLPVDFTADMDIPEYAEDMDPVVCYTGEGNHTATFGATNYMAYRDYLTKLTEAGFSEYSTNKLGRNYFATYVKDTENESMAVHMMFFEKLFRVEITYGPLDEFLPGTEAVPIPTDGAVTPTITQLARNGSTQTAPGMSAILQLADASFVIFDGGPYDVQDEMDLYNFMRQRTPEGQKPVIAAWFITHAHGDHMGLALNFLRARRNDVELRLGAFNFPDFDGATIQNESAATMKSMAMSFKNLVLSYPDAEYWVMHTGQTLLLPGCEIDVLYTPEDAGSTTFAWGNHTCTAVRVTLNDTTFTVLGDAEKTLCQQMADAYGSSIQSDILSLSHHGFNGACLDLYKCINPDICFWPVDGARYNEDPRCTGAQWGYDFNAWLRNDAIKAREHYTADETKTIVC